MNQPTQTDVTGNEWMNVRKVDRALLADLRPREAVLADAREGIEKHRRTDITVRIVDRSTGEAVRGARVSIEQVAHAFEFGCSAGFTFPQTREDPVKQARARLFADLFNCTTAKCYWDECWHQPIEQEQGVRVTRTFLDEIDWAVAHGLRVRGHPLVWMVPKAVPQWVLKYPYEKQLQFVEHNVRSLIQCTQGRVKLWDLVNEMLWEPSLRHLPHREWPHIETVDEMLSYIEPAIQWARDEDPTSTYVLNDYGLELNLVTLNGRTVTATDQRRRFRELVDAMQKRNCAPDAIGTQAHDGTWSPPDVFKKVLDDLASTGVPVQVAEFWAHDNACPNHESMSPEQVRDAKIQYVTDCYTIAFGHPRVTHFTCWGNEMFYEDGDPTVRHYKAAWMPSRLYRAVHDLVKNKWWTPRTTLQTNSTGEITLRATHGRHRVTVVRPGGRQWSTEIDVCSANAATTIEVV